jgi:hypothetical protein
MRSNLLQLHQTVVHSTIPRPSHPTQLPNATRHSFQPNPFAFSLEPSSTSHPRCTIHRITHKLDSFPVKGSKTTDTGEFGPFCLSPASRHPTLSFPTISINASLTTSVIQPSAKFTGSNPQPDHDCGKTWSSSDVAREIDVSRV